MTLAEADEEPTRPALRWHGGKWLLAPWIISCFPPHRRYVEPFGGAASVLLRKPRVYAEVWNDLDGEVVNFFRVLRDPAMAARLVELLELTPYSRAEFEVSRTMLAAMDDVERARTLVVRSFMGFGSNAHSSMPNGHRQTGFRASSNRSGTTPSGDWRNYPDSLRQIISRMRGVNLESRPAAFVIEKQDSPETLFYCDPPYVHATRSSGAKHDDVKYRMYRHEMNDAGHAELLEQLRSVKGMVVLSGYHTDLYDQALAGWTRREKETYADGARPRTEVLWLNPQACEARARAQGEMFR